VFAGLRQCLASAAPGESSSCVITRGEAVEVDGSVGEAHKNLVHLGGERQRRHLELTLHHGPRAGLDGGLIRDGALACSYQTADLWVELHKKRAQCAAIGGTRAAGQHRTRASTPQ